MLYALTLRPHAGVPTHCCLQALGSQHRGYAFVSLDSLKAAETAEPVLGSLPLGKSTLSQGTVTGLHALRHRITEVHPLDSSLHHTRHSFADIVLRLLQSACLRLVCVNAQAETVAQFRSAGPLPRCFQTASLSTRATRPSSGRNGLTERRTLHGAESDCK